MSSGRPALIQTIVTTEDAGNAQMRVFSRGEADEGASWTLHATATLLRSADSVDPAAMAETQKHCPETVDAAGYYAQMRADGHDYGPAFQVITSL